MFATKFTSTKRAAAWMLLAMPVPQVAADACIAGWNGSAYVWPMFGYCQDNAGVIWDCHNKCGQKSTFAITCSTDCQSKTYAATGEGDCVQDDGHTSCQNRQISTKAACTVGTACNPPLVASGKEKCDGNELVVYNTAIGLNKLFLTGSGLQTAFVLGEPASPTSTCWGGKGAVVDNKNTYVEIRDKANGDNNKK